MGIISGPDYEMKVLVARSDLTRADRTWCVHYQPGDVLYYSRGSQQLGIDPGSYASVLAVDQKANQLTVEDPSGRQIMYDPKRLQGITAYQETIRLFSVGDRVQFTSTNRELGVSNRDLGIILNIEKNRLTLRLDDNGRIVTFDPNRMLHIDLGYAVTSYSSQGLTANQVLINVDTKNHPELIDSRFAYVSASRASGEARIFTDNVEALGTRLSTTHSKNSALETRYPDLSPVTNQPLGERLSYDVTNASAIEFAKTREPLVSNGSPQMHGNIPAQSGGFGLSL